MANARDVQAFIWILRACAVIGQLVSGDFIDDSRCGVTAGCLRTPALCKLPDCTHFLLWTDNGTQVDMELFGKPDSSIAKPWTAVGFSNDTKMPGTYVTDCIYDASTEKVVIQSSWNVEGKHNNIPLSPDNQLGLVEGSTIGVYADGYLHCKFSRYKVVNTTLPNSDKVPNFNIPYYIILAIGPANGTGYKSFHTMPPSVYRDKIKMDEHLNIGGSISGPFVKAHGCLMVIAWLVMVNLATIVAKAFKGSATLIGSGLWFQIHRGLICAGFILTAIAIVLIVYEAGGFMGLKSPLWHERAHPVTGIIVCCLMVVNITMGLFRPHPGEPRRELFNWAHHLVGISALALSAFSISTGLRMTKANVAYWAFVTFLITAALRGALSVVLNVINRRMIFERDDSNMVEVTSTKYQQLTNAKVYLFWAGFVVFVSVAVALVSAIATAA